MALILLASLKRMLLVRPLAVITTLPPEQDRARLARSILDSLGLHDVPVGIGTQIDMPDEKLNLSCFEGVHVGQNDFEWGDVLMSRVLRDAKDCSVKILCIANLKDVSTLIVKHKDLCCAKVKEIVMMGGAIIQDGTFNPILWHSTTTHRFKVPITFLLNVCITKSRRLPSLALRRMIFNLRCLGSINSSKANTNWLNASENSTIKRWKRSGGGVMCRLG